MSSAKPLAFRPPGSLFPSLRGWWWRLRRSAGAVAARAWGRRRQLRREHLLGVALLVLFLIYALVLLLDPTSAGRGGR